MAMNICLCHGVIWELNAVSVAHGPLSTPPMRVGLLGANFDRACSLLCRAQGISFPSPPFRLLMPGRGARWSCIVHGLVLLAERGSIHPH